MFHQTPTTLACDLMKYIPLIQNDVVAEPFCGEGAFYNAFPKFVERKKAEIEEGIDYTKLDDFDWVITNPPFRIETTGTRINAVWMLLDHFSKIARKGIAFLINDKCFSALTPHRLHILHQRGWNITSIVVCSIKKWRGRYYFIILQKQDGLIQYLTKNYE